MMSCNIQTVAALLLFVALQASIGQAKIELGSCDLGSSPAPLTFLPEQYNIKLEPDMVASSVSGSVEMVANFRGGHSSLGSKILCSSKVQCEAERRLVVHVDKLLDVDDIKMTKTDKSGKSTETVALERACIDRKNQVVEVIPSSEMLKGDKLTVTISFHGAVGEKGLGSKRPGYHKVPSYSVNVRAAVPHLGQDVEATYTYELVHDKDLLWQSNAPRLGGSTDEFDQATGKVTRKLGPMPNMSPKREYLETPDGEAHTYTYYVWTNDLTVDYLL